MKVLSAESQAIASRVLALPCAVRPLEQLRRLLFGRGVSLQAGAKPGSAWSGFSAADEMALSLEESRALLADTRSADALAVAIADLRPWLEEEKQEPAARAA